MKHIEVPEQEKVEVDLSLVEILREARKLLEEKGWCQNQLMKYEYIYGTSTPVSFCPMGAIMNASVSYPSPYLKEKEALLILERAVNKGWIPYWNDRQGRTKEEVLAGIDKAIELATKEAFDAVR